MLLSFILSGSSVWPFIFGIFPQWVLNRQYVQRVTSVCAHHSLCLVPKSLFLESIGWRVESIFKTPFFPSVYTLYTPTVILIGETGVCCLIDVVISTLFNLWICCNSSSWQLFVTVFISSNSGNAFVKYADIILTGQNYTWFYVAFTCIFPAGVFWPLHILFKYFVNIFVAIRTACKDINNYVVLLSPSRESFIWPSFI